MKFWWLKYFHKWIKMTLKLLSGILIEIPFHAFRHRANKNDNSKNKQKKPQYKLKKTWDLQRLLKKIQMLFCIFPPLYYTVKAQHSAGMLLNEMGRGWMIERPLWAVDWLRNLHIMTVFLLTCCSHSGADGRAKSIGRDEWTHTYTHVNVNTQTLTI